ncbi:MAG: TVP38/TMEM64 family protein [Pseudomonadota bacterium]
MTRQTTEVETRRREVLRAFARWSPALLLIAATAWLYATGLATDISLDNLQAHEIRLRGEVAASPMLALAVFTALYAVATAAFVPVGLVMMLAGGFLFGPLVGALTTIVGSTLGAIMAYLAARFAAGDHVRNRLAASRLRRLVEGFERAPFGFLLTLRLAPLSPFGLVNVAAGCARAPFRPYVAATALGAVPHSLIYSYLGAGLGGAFLTGRPPTVAILLTPTIAWPLTALAVVSLLAARMGRRDRAAPGQVG